MAENKKTFVEFKDERIRKYLKLLNKNFFSIEKKQKAYAGAISSFIFSDIEDHFQKEMGPDGKWKDWSPTYKDIMAGKYHIRAVKGTTRFFRIPGRDPELKQVSGNILQNTRRMFNHFQPSHWRKVSDGFIWYNNAKTKSGFPYAYAHNEGGPKLPQRRFMWLSDSALDKISRVTLRFLEGEAK